MKNESAAPKELRFVIMGTGFWARYQLAAWRELSGAIAQSIRQVGVV